MTAEAVSAEEREAEQTAEVEFHEVSATTTPTFGRYLIEGEQIALVSDSISKGETVAPTPVDLLATSLAVCALGSVEKWSRELEITLPEGARAQVGAERDVAYPTWFRRVAIHVEVPGVTQAVAEELVGKFTKSCPIFNTVRRGSSLTVEVASSEGSRNFFASTLVPYEDGEAR